MKIWLNGCFDVLHHGHFKMIQHATSFGGQVMIGIDSDKRVKELKGDQRPFHNEKERSFNLKQIKGVDTVVVLILTKCWKNISSGFLPTNLLSDLIILEKK